ncbi:MAG: hypothetical protein CMB47_00675 [Euryarchaeota archaeon]|nr:hypothetical protein [Euryarchaeota archaeon]|tara:strand:- start:36838 stop:38304 length:1467 start_codon:yes stop_codon:yes gene_type:complete
MVILLFLSSLIPILNNANAQENTSYQSINFNSDSPLNVNNSTVVYGYASSNQNSITISWKLEYSEILYDSGQIILNSESNNFQNPTYQWQIFLDFLSYPNSCTCYLTVILESSSPQIIIKPIFFSLDDELLEPALIIDDNSNDLFSDKIYFSGNAWSFDNSLPNLYWNIIKTNSQASSCKLDSSEILTNSMGIESSFTYQFSFENELDISNYDDGFYSLYLWANTLYNTNSLNSEFYCRFIQVDNNKPISIIQSQENLKLLEGFSPILFDGSVSSDPFFGRSKLNFVWVLSQHIPNLNDDKFHLEVINVSSGDDERTFLIDSLNSGNYSLILTVTDESGLSNSSSLDFSITNMAPVAKLSIDDVEIFDGDSLILLQDQEIDLDATESSDTENDILSLGCIWKVNNVPFYEGCKRTFSWPESVNDNEFILSLEVTDNDNLISKISINIKSESSREGTYFSLTFLFISIIFVSYAFYKRYNIMDEKIPKW